MEEQTRKNYEFLGATLRWGLIAISFSISDGPIALLSRYTRNLGKAHYLINIRLRQLKFLLYGPDLP